MRKLMIWYNNFIAAINNCYQTALSAGYDIKAEQENRKKMQLVNNKIEGLKEIT